MEENPKSAKNPQKPPKIVLVGTDSGNYRIFGK